MVKNIYEKKFDLKVIGKNKKVSVWDELRNYICVIDKLCDL